MRFEQCLGRLGSNVLGIDAVAENIQVATEHASHDRLLQRRVKYEHSTTSDLVRLGEGYGIMPQDPAS
jgi:2-polyprenyl-3-methyl-5-hydroxy-6-metoxy-1,4-benzoquinol methylase